MAHMIPMRNIILTFLILALLGGCALQPQQRKAAANDQDPAQALYESGRSALLARDYERAIAAFRRLEALYPQHDTVPQARMELAYGLYKRGDTLSAVAVAERFIRDYPRHPNVDYLYYLRGLAAYEQSLAFLEHQAELEEPAMPPLAQLAIQYFDTLIERFPTSKYREDARARLGHLQDALARLEIHWAKRALARGDYATAALHARAVMEKYPQSSHYREATALLSMTDRALDQTPQLITPVTPSAPGDVAVPVATPAPGTSVAQTAKVPAIAAAEQTNAVPDAGAAEVDAASNTDTVSPDTETVTRGSDENRSESRATGPRQEDWLLRQPANAYTLQLLATANRRALLDFVRRHGLQNQAAYVTGRRNGRPWYTLVYGVYPDRTAALGALAGLPAAVRAQHPWPRRLGSVQALAITQNASVGP